MSAGEYQQFPDMGDELAKALEELYSINQELGIRMKEELDAAARGEENILLVGTNGDFTVTILHVDPEFVNHSREITLLPTSSSVSILAAVSRDFIEDQVRICEAMEADGDGTIADELWDTFMGDLMEGAVEAHLKNPRTF